MIWCHLLKLAFFKPQNEFVFDTIIHSLLTETLFCSVLVISLSSKFVLSVRLFVFNYFTSYSTANGCILQNFAITRIKETNKKKSCNKYNSFINRIVSYSQILNSPILLCPLSKESKLYRDNRKWVLS